MINDKEFYLKGNKGKFYIPDIKSGIEEFFKKNPTRTIVLGFAFIILFGAILLAAPVSNNDGKWLNFLDSLFMATSGVCVTGLVVVDPGVQFTLFGQLVLMILVQIGGLGFMTAATFLFIVMGKKITLQHKLVIKESFDENKVQGSIKLIKGILVYTFIIEGIVALFLMITFIPEYGFAKGFYFSIFHSISSFCNAGFDIVNTKATAFSSISAYNNNLMVLIPLGINIFLGGIGFATIADIATHKRRKRRLSSSTKIVLISSFAIVFSVALFILILEWNGAMKDYNIIEKIVSSIFQAVTSRTAGFATIDIADLNPGSRLAMMATMFVGASPASTGGGIKTTTFVLLLYITLATILGKKKILIDKTKINEQQIRKTLTIFFLFVLIIFIAVTLFYIVETVYNANKVNMESLLFETLSALTTTGLTYGITPQLTRFTRFGLALLMFLGRCGTITIGMAIVSAKPDIKHEIIDYPDSKIRIG